MEGRPLYLNGEWRRTPLCRPVVNPYTGESVAEVCQASARDIEEGIAGATAAFEATRRMSSHRRGEILRGIAEGIAERKDELAGSITRETGKPITASHSEVGRAIFTFQTAADETRRGEGHVIPLDLLPGSEGRSGIIRRFPIGPVAGITPFNFPLNLVAHKVAPAIASGNPILLKPSSNAPTVALLLGEIGSRTGIPKGGFQVLPCLSGEAEQLVTDERVKLISFTGSPAVGWGIKARSGKKRVVLELGGNAGVILDADANLEKALPRILWGSFGNAGQSCIAVQRIFVHSTLYDEFLNRFVPMTREAVVGDPFDPRTLVGPMITESAARGAEEWIREGVAGGARVLTGGGRRGALLEPTIMVNVAPEMKVCSQEVFAPVVTVEPFDTFADAVGRVNASAYGLQAGVFSNTLDHVMSAYESLEVGGVIVNDVPTYRIDHMPYGGVKDSGFGREGIRYAIESMTEGKLLALSPP